MWQRFDFLHFKNSEIGFPPMILKQRIIIGTDMFRSAPPRSAVDYQLLLQKKFLCDDYTSATGLMQLSQGGQQVKK
jgi:hypothetical protein